MKAKPFFVLVLFSAVLPFSGRSQTVVPLDDLSQILTGLSSANIPHRYYQGLSWSSYFAQMLSNKYEYAKRAKPVMLATQFPSDRIDITKDCSVFADGRVLEIWSDPLGVKGCCPVPLSTNQFQLLTEAVRCLPDGGELPALTNLLILTYAKGSYWTTSTYNSAHAPAEVIRLFEICGCGLGYDPNIHVLAPAGQTENDRK